MVVKLAFYNPIVQFLASCGGSKLKRSDLQMLSIIIIPDLCSLLHPQQGETLPPSHPASAKYIVCVLEHFSEGFGGRESDNVFILSWTPSPNPQLQIHLSPL